MGFMAAEVKTTDRTLGIRLRARVWKNAAEVLGWQIPAKQSPSSRGRYVFWSRVELLVGFVGIRG